MVTEYKIGQKFYHLSDEEYSKIAQYCNDNNGIYLSREDGYFEIKEDDFKLTEEEQVYFLRLQRQSECFSVINRGSFWYDTLTEEQKEELKVWYNEWLTLPNRYGTKDFYMPKKPNWLK